MKAIADCRLYGILDFGYVAPGRAASVADQMVEGGVDILQIRAKNLAGTAIVEIANAIRRITRDAGVPLIINDHPGLVEAAGADGVHLGQDDMPAGEARELMKGASGRSAVRMVGKSTHSVEQAEAAAAEGADYIGFGPLFATPTKPDYKPIGLRDIREARRRANVPVFCIGGIKQENLASVLAAGAQRVVMVSGILKATSIVAYCRAAKEMLEAHLSEISESESKF